jgi:hemerythrin
MEEKIMAQDFIKGFQNDHRKVIDHLIELQAAIQADEMPKARDILKSLDRLVGPHFKFEEEHLYPELRLFLGERIDEMLKEHEGAVSITGSLVNYLSKDKHSQEEKKAALRDLSGFFVHAANCDGLVLLAERLTEEKRRELTEKFQQTKKEKVLLSQRL